MHESATLPWGGKLQLPGWTEFRGAWMILTWIAMATILLVPYTNVFLPFTGQKYSVMSVVWLLLLLCLIIAPSFLRKGFSPILGWMALLFGIRYVYGWMLSDFPANMADSTRNMIRPMMWAWVLSAVMQDGRLRRLGCDLFVLTAFTAAALHTLGVGATQGFGSTGMERVSAFQLNANVLGVIYASAFLMAFARVIQPGEGYGFVRRLLFAGAGILCIAALNLAGSRTSAVFAVLGSIALIAIEMRRAGKSLPAVFAVVGLVVAGWIAAAAHSVIVERTNVVVRGGVESEARLKMAPILIEQFLRSPFYGLGPENYRLELGNRSGAGEPGAGVVAHNQLLMFAVEMGVVGLIPFLSMCVILLRHAWRLRAREGGLPFALAFPCIFTAWVSTNIAFHWHFHFIVALTAAGMAAMRREEGGEAL